MYADLDANNRLVRFGDQVAESVELNTDGTTSTTQLTGQSEEAYTDEELTAEWLLNRYNLALAQAVRTTRQSCGSKPGTISRRCSVT